MTETLCGPKGHGDMLSDNKQILNLDWTVQLLKHQCLFSSYMLEVKSLDGVIVLLHGQETGVSLRHTASGLLFLFRLFGFFQNLLQVIGAKLTLKDARLIHRR